MQRATALSSHHFAMQFINIICHSEQEGFGQNIRCAASQEAAESIILFEYAKRAFGLDRAIEPQHLAFGTGDPLQGRLAQGNKLLGNLQAAVALGAGT